MRIVITGGAGFIGMKLVSRLLSDGAAAGPNDELRPVTKLVLFDQSPPIQSLPNDPRIEFVQGDITREDDVRRMLEPETGGVFHLAAVVSSAAEACLDLGLAVNLSGTLHVLNACRNQPKPPRLIFASSAAVYGGDPPFTVTDGTPPTPRTSYGAQKLCGEVLVSDYSRRGIIDGRSLRLPTIVVRPGKPNKAASTFASSILREPLAGKMAICPVRRESRMAILSPRLLVDCIMQVYSMNRAKLEGDRTVLLPSISVSIGEMLDGLRRSSGEEVVSRVRFEADPAIQRIVDSWPESMTSERAARLGLSADESIDAIIQAFTEDDLPAQRALAAAE